MSHTIEDFRNFFKPNKKKELFLLYDALEQSIQICKSRAENYKVKLELELNSSIEISGYRNELMQVFINFITNSIDAARQNAIKKAYVKIRECPSVDEYICLEVSDNCGGINEKIKDKIFEPYFTTQRATGTGIGLYMCKMIVENSMGGIVEFLNNEEGGSTFIVKLQTQGGFHDENT